MKNKKIIIIIIVVILIALIIYALLTRESGDIVVSKDKPELSLVDDYLDFISINRIVNDYLLNISIDNQEVIKDITGTDLLVSNSKEKATYYAKQVYKISLENLNDYYYVTGNKMVFDYGTSKMYEVKDDCYQITVDRARKSFKIKKIGNIHNYYNEEDLYDNVKISLNDYNDFTSYSLSYTDTLIYDNYINYFKDLLFVNYQEAYNLLEDSYKQKVGSLDNFIDLREELYNKLNNIVKDHAITGDNKNRVYTLILHNDTKITIIENNGIMNVKFKIEN